LTSCCSTRRGPEPGRHWCAAIAAREPSVIVYVACDPAALARDTAALAAAGYRLDTLRAFDAFRKPNTSSASRGTCATDLLVGRCSAPFAAYHAG